MKMFNEEIQAQLREVFNDLRDNVTIALFTKEGECYTCEETLAYMQEVVELSDKLTLERFDIEKNDDKAKEYNIEMVQALSFSMQRESIMG